MEGDHRLFGFALDRDPKVLYHHNAFYKDKKYCGNCYKSGALNYQALVKTNHENYLAYRREIGKELKVAIELIESKKKFLIVVMMNWKRKKVS